VARRRLIGARCLPRSLTLWFLLRRRGVDAQLVVGAAPELDRRAPGHAWVEVDGVALSEAPDVRERYGSFGLTLPGLDGSVM
jgi:hypothetical protein